MAAASRPSNTSGIASGTDGPLMGAGVARARAAKRRVVVVVSFMAGCVLSVLGWCDVFDRNEV